MPVRSLTPSLLRWPEPEPVLNQVRLWAVQVAAEHPGPQHQRLLAWPLAALPLSFNEQLWR